MDGGVMKKLFYIIGIVVLLFAFFTLRELRTVTTEHSSAVQRADSLEAIAANLRHQNDSTAILLDSLVRDNANKSDSLAKFVKQIEIVTAENDSIKKAIALIPPDTVYKLMQETVPDNLPKPYIYSAPQIKFYYSAYVSDVQKTELLKTHEKALYGCLDYSAGLGKQIELLNVRNSNTEKQLALADLQTELFKDSSQKLSNRVATLEKWQPYYKTGIVVSFIVGFFVGK
jgi:hypothetical protein